MYRRRRGSVSRGIQFWKYLATWLLTIFLGGLSSYWRRHHSLFSLVWSTILGSLRNMRGIWKMRATFTRILISPSRPRRRISINLLRMGSLTQLITRAMQALPRGKLFKFKMLNLPQKIPLREAIKKSKLMLLMSSSPHRIESQIQAIFKSQW